MKIRELHVLYWIMILVLGGSPLYGADVSQDTSGAREQDKQPNEVVGRIMDQEYERSLQSILPLTPEQIERFNRRQTANKEAIQPSTPPALQGYTKQISLNSGTPIPVVKIAPGYVTSVSIFDVTGAPWPISSITNGDSSNFRVTRINTNKNNVLTIAAKRKFVSTNIVVTLETLSQPISIQARTVFSEDEQVSSDALVNFQILDRGPLAIEISNTDSDVSARPISDVMMLFVDNTPPGDASEVTVQPDLSGVSVWRHAGSYYLRLNNGMSLLFPAWKTGNGIARGVNGVKVYCIPVIDSLVISKGGESLSLIVGE